VTVHGIVIAFLLLLLLPWGLVGVEIVGATASAVKRGLAHLQRAGWVRGRGEAALSPPQARKWEHRHGNGQLYQRVSGGGMSDPVRERRAAVSPGLSRRRGSALVWILLAVRLAIPGLGEAAELTPERQDEIVAARIESVRPGVVGILTVVSAEVTVRCGKDDVYVVKPVAERESGTGFIIHPDGWIATNGHVVKPVFEDDDEHITTFLRAAADAACGPALERLPMKQRRARMAAILRDPANRQGVRLTKQLEVYLPTGLVQKGFPAVVKAYSGPIDPARLPTDGSTPKPPMLDAAILKIEATNLPVVRMAASIQEVYPGQQLVIVGYPGVVLWHDFLSKKTQAESTVTYGRVSSFRLDVNERWILQTDAAISWGNSGGPAFNLRGEVVALATFISTSLEGDQAIQGFNFLIPVDTIHTMMQEIGVTPSSNSPFMREWDTALEAFIEGRLRESLAHAEAADKLVPGLIDVRRSIARLRALLGETPLGRHDAEDRLSRTQSPGRAEPADGQRQLSGLAEPSPSLPRTTAPPPSPAPRAPARRNGSPGWGRIPSLKCRGGGGSRSGHGGSLLAIAVQAVRCVRRVGDGP